jgi:hypothetical protein
MATRKFSTYRNASPVQKPLVFVSLMTTNRWQHRH